MVLDIVEELQKRLHPAPRIRYSGKYSFLEPINRIDCADGHRLSVQANEHCYCGPKNNSGPWYEVEIGFPTFVDERLRKYCQDWEGAGPTNTVYSYVPINLVAEIINDHGGIALSNYEQGVEFGKSLNEVLNRVTGRKFRDD